MHLIDLDDIDLVVVVMMSRRTHAIIVETAIYSTFYRMLTLHDFIFTI